MPFDDTEQVTCRAARPEDAARIAPLVYDSSHELLEFMFRTRENAEKALARLLKKPDGHFGYRFATVMLMGEEIVGVELGYDRKQLAGQEMAGAVNMLTAMKISGWPHLLGTVGRALSGYVPPPSADAYYINNIAVDGNRRGMGLGRRLLDEVVERAKKDGYRCIELDVTAPNDGAIRFYRSYGFRPISTSGSKQLEKKYGLPVLQRMRFLLHGDYGIGRDNYGHATSTTVINDISGLNPVQVDEVYAPGSIANLQAVLKSTDKPVSIGGGRFSMGGQIAAKGTLHIDMRGLNQVLSVDADARTMQVQAGARWKDVQRVLGDYGLAVKVMQTYSSFTVGGSISVNCHGRYVGLGPLILSLRGIRIMLHDGELIDASPEENTDVFYASVGGYGALGIIVEATFDLAENCRIARKSRKMRLDQYPAFFRERIRGDEAAVFHNADMVPPRFEKVRAITWQETDKPATQGEKRDGRNLYLAERYMLWAITETPLGHWRREYIYEPLLYLKSVVKYRNQEADYDVAELEPLSRDKKTYVLQEYFVPVDRLTEFTAPMTEILNRYKVKVVNVSIRHAHPDPGSLMAWAREEVFALVLYYKQGTSACERESVAVWTREMIEAVLQCGGTYYLPYQPHARPDQFERAYPGAARLFELKDSYDPNYRFRGALWEKYYRPSDKLPESAQESLTESEFLTVYGDVVMRDAFYRFLQTIYHLYPEDRFHQLIIDVCGRHDDDESIYREVARRLADIQPFLSDLTYALPALGKQKREMRSQTVDILPTRDGWQGYLEIGSTGRYVKGLKKALNINGPVYLTNDIKPDLSPPEIMERGGVRQVGEFFGLEDYAPISSQVEDESLDLVTCYIGLHHCPREKLDSYIESIHRVLRPGGAFVLRDHDAGSDRMRTFCKLVHTVFNAGLGVPWETDRKEVRLFEGIDFWVEAVESHGFSDSGRRLLQANDPSLNTLLCFVK